MRNFSYILIFAVIGMLACSRSTRHRQVLSEAERIVTINPDSALRMLSGIHVSDLKEDSLRALYALLVASAHKYGENSMTYDSLTRFAFEYYKGHNDNRFFQAGNLYVLHRFWLGDGNGALELLDSLTGLPNVPDDLMIELLRSRFDISVMEYDSNRSLNIKYIKKLQALDKDSAHQIEYKHELGINCQFAGYMDSALSIIDELIDFARVNHLEEDLFEYTVEKVGILEELGRYNESNNIVDYVLEHAQNNLAIPYLRFYKALNYFNMGNYTQSCHELAIADSCAKNIKGVEPDYYESFAAPLREFLKYRRDGFVGINRLAIINNRQRIFRRRLESTQWETEKNALEQENRALTLKAQNERKATIIIIVTLVAVLVGLAAVWNIQKRKRKTVEAEERAETLQKMIDEMSAPSALPTWQESLRRVMLQQLGIIKMVAETPTEQNREMLRKISSIESDTKGSLVDWSNIFEIIDNLYSGFYSRLHDRYGDKLTDKEEQIIVLMVAGFSTKEISVISTQSIATIYVRKSAIRKKLGLAEKEDIVAFLRK